MKVKIKTEEALKSEGFKKDYPCWYKGSKRDSDISISHGVVNNLCGQTVDIVRVVDHERGFYTVMYLGRFWDVPEIMFEKNVKLKELKRVRTFKIGKNEAEYNYGVFRFPCDFDTLDNKDAVALAKWVLKVAGK